MRRQRRHPLRGGGVEGPAPKQEAKPKPLVMAQAALLATVSAKECPPEQSQEDIMEHDIVDTVAHASALDTATLLHILAERKMQVHLLGKRECVCVWYCILRFHNASELLNHATWYHTRRSAAPKRPEMDSGVQDLAVGALSFEDELGHARHTRPYEDVYCGSYMVRKEARGRSTTRRTHVQCA